MINYIRKDNEKLKNNVVKKKIEMFFFNVEENWVFI
jgi:hypothetical protein